MIGPGESSQCQTWLERRFSWNENLQRRRIKLRSQVLSSEQLYEPKSLDVALNIAGAEKISSENLRLRSTLRLFDSRFEWKSVSDGGNLCSLWLVILKSVWNCVGDTFHLRYSWPWAVVSYTCSYTYLHTAVPWNGLEHSHRKVRLSVYFTWFWEVMFWCFIPDINQCVNSYFETEKSWFFWINWSHKHFVYRVG